MNAHARHDGHAHAICTKRLMLSMVGISNGIIEGGAVSGKQLNDRRERVIRRCGQ